MEGLGVLLLVLAVLVPSITKLINSVAYRIRAKGKAEILRAKSETKQVNPGHSDSKGGKGRGDGR
ncbi:hypothetical protein ACFPH6_25030 [Streptomyces xiangluensis]|uniref:Sec-independent protein translocase protein TatA n=1 Tax=Streptomyces xiangluensis TaxID=2665720 RepID=A0ABV8YSR3_9ACTN